MGNSVADHPIRRKQPESHQLSVSDIPNHVVMEGNKRILRMAESKVVMFILNILGIPFYGYTLWINIDNFKGWILLTIASLFGIAKLFFYIRRQFQAIHKENQEASFRDLKLKREILDEREREVKLLEEELSLRVTGKTTEQRKKDGNNFKN
jgi:uncharacterized membrane protein